MKRVAAFLCIVLVLCVLLTACNSSSPSFYKGDNAGKESADMIESGISTDTEKSDDNLTENTGKDLETRKLIKDVSLDIETRSFDKFMSQLEGEISKNGGFIQKSDVQGKSYDSNTFRYATIIARIPAAKLDSFTGQISKLGNVTGKTEGTQDVTMDYVDIQSHIKALKTEQTSLLKLLEKADSLDDILTIQKHLTDVRYQLESFESKIRTYDDLIDYSTVTLSINEVERVTPTQEQNIWQEIGTNLSGNLDSIGSAGRNLFVWLVSASPFMVIIGIIALVVILIVRLSNKRSRRRSQNAIVTNNDEDNNSI